VRLLLLLMLIVPPYFITVFTVQETSTVNRIGFFETLLPPPNQVKMSTTEIDSEIIVFDGIFNCCVKSYYKKTQETISVNSN
jgi:hypothetical protein